MSYSTGTASEPVHLFVVGLGNKPLPDTRHSIGHYIIDSLAKRFEMRLINERGGWLRTKEVDLPHASGPVKLTLFRSKQLMNCAGPSIVQGYRAAGASSKTKSGVSPEDPKRASGRNLVVLGDSIEHPPRKLHTRLGGSANGHNGIKSIQQAMGGTMREFWQYRVGVGRGSSAEDAKIDKKIDAAVWVMGPLSPSEKKYWGPQGEGMETVLSELGKAAKALEELRVVKPPVVNPPVEA